MNRHTEAKPIRVSKLNVGDYLSFKSGRVHVITMSIKHGRYERQIYFEPETQDGRNGFFLYGVDELYRLPKRLGKKLFQVQEATTSHNHMINIENLRQTKDGIRCDRRSKLGNPFYMLDENSRDAVCDAYQMYFDLVVHDKTQPKEAIERVSQQFPKLKVELKFTVFNRASFIEKLNSIPVEATLLCWCAPKRCHCETIKHYMEQVQ